MSTQMDLESKRIPVFCTAVQSIELLQEFTASTSPVNQGEGECLPTIMTSTSFEEGLIPRPEPTESWIKPFLEKGSPFLGWTPKEVRNFYVGNCTDYQGFDAWPLGTFGILDAQSVLDPDSPTHRTILLCSSLPDFREELEVWLKTCRVRFEDFEGEVGRLETLTSRPSELGKGTCLSFMPPLMLIGRDEARGRVSFDIDNEAPYSQEHMAMQGGSQGCVRYFIRRMTPRLEAEPQDDAQMTPAD